MRTGWRSLFRRLFAYDHPKTLRQTAWLDGLRGVASFEVMITHYQASWGYSIAAYGMTHDSKQFWRLPMFRPLYNSGNAMVCVFFVISGYVLTIRSLQLLRRSEYDKFYSSLGSSVFRRYLRLYVPAMVSTIASFILVCLGIEGQGPDGIPPNLPTVWEQFKNWMIENERFCNILNYTNNGNSIAHRYANVIWTIPMEYMGSMVVFVIMLSTARMAPKIRNTIIFLLGVLFLSEGHWGFFCFTSGVLLADLDTSTSEKSESIKPQSSPNVRIGGKRYIFLLGFAYWTLGVPIRRFPGEQVFGYSLIYAVIPEKTFRFELHRTIWALAGVLTVYTVPRVPVAKRFLESNFCQYLAKLSFSTYLLHFMIMHCFATPIKKWLFMNLVMTDEMAMSGQDASQLGVGLAYIIWFPIMISINFIIAGVFERVVDAPTVKFSRWVENYFLWLSARAETITWHPSTWISEEPLDIRWVW